MSMDTLKQLTDSDRFQVFDIKDVSTLLNLGESIGGNEGLNMTSLRSLLLLSENQDENVDDLNRLSLAYERLHLMPKIIQREIAPHIKILDISHNEFETLDFLCDFTELTTLICDHNSITANTEIPYLPKLDLLWLNHCKILELYPWASKLRKSCPNLRFLSLMGNPAAPSYINGGNFYDYLQYRYFMISLFPKLVHLDDRVVTYDQRLQTRKLYRTQILETAIAKTVPVPECFNSLRYKIFGMFGTVPDFLQEKSRNYII